MHQLSFQWGCHTFSFTLMWTRPFWGFRGVSRQCKYQYGKTEWCLRNEDILKKLNHYNRKGPERFGPCSLLFQGVQAQKYIPVPSWHNWKGCCAGDSSSLRGLLVNMSARQSVNTKKAVSCQHFSGCRACILQPGYPLGRSIFRYLLGFVSTVILECCDPPPRLWHLSLMREWIFVC